MSTNNLKPRPLSLWPIKLYKKKKKCEDVLTMFFKLFFLLLSFQNLLC